MATLALLPAIVCAVIMMVNGNVGTGVAVGRRIQSGPFSVCAGKCQGNWRSLSCHGFRYDCWHGIPGLCCFVCVLLGGISVIYNKTDFGERKNAAKYKTLHVTIPENLDYSGVFDEIFADYAEKWELVNVKTTNMGSLYKLTYQLTMKNTDREKEMIDEIRCRNGNLEINVSKQDTMVSEL